MSERKKKGKHNEKERRKNEKIKIKENVKKDRKARKNKE